MPSLSASARCVPARRFLVGRPVEEEAMRMELEALGPRGLVVSDMTR